MSFQTQLTNHTPFAAEKFVLIDPEGQEATLVVMAASFEHPARSGPLQVAGEQAPPWVEDVYAGDPSGSSLLQENEMVLSKPKVDVIVVGTAHAPGGRATDRVPIELKAGDIRKSLWVSGYRGWAMRAPSRPVPFVTLPVRYELAFGGTIPKTGASLPANPVGMGWKGAVARGDVRAEVPNIEYPDSMIRGPSDEIRPAGLGPIARWWQPRVGYAGTYDDKWLESRWPLLPRDFDPRFNQIAPVDQQSASLAGGELVRLTNLTPDGMWQFTLPQLSVPVHLVYDDRLEEARLRLDTVVIEPDRRRVRLTARLTRPTVRGAVALREIVLGHMTRGWLRSARSRKPYIDRRGTGGAAPSVPCHQA